MRFVSIFALAAALSAPATKPANIAVIPFFVGPKRSPGVSELNARLASAARGRPGVRVIDAEELFVREASDPTAALEECGSDARCLANELRRFDLELAVLAIINSEVSPPLIAFRVLDIAKSTIAAEAVLPDESKIESSFEHTLDALGFAQKKDAAPIEVATPAPPAPEASLTDSPIFWIAVGAGIIATTAAAVILATSSSGTDLCLGPPGSNCP